MSNIQESFSEVRVMPALTIKNYRLPLAAKRFLRVWRTRSDDWVTEAELNILAVEVIIDHNRAAAGGVRFTPPATYRDEQVIFASKLPHQEILTDFWYEQKAKKVNLNVGSYQGA